MVALVEPVAIRRARPEDVPFLRRLSADVFLHFGRYDQLIPEWFGYPGVVTHVGEVDGAARAFTMLGFYEEGSRQYVGDLLAIAVDVATQGRGVGGALLRHAIGVARRAGARAVLLSVADTNHPARRLFERHGFALLPGDHGFYDGGQKTLKMRRALGQAGDAACP